MRPIEVRTDTGKTHQTNAEEGQEVEACYRIADLHRVTIVAWRELPVRIVIADTQRIIG